MTDLVGSHIQHDATLGTPNHSKTLVLKAQSAGRRYLVDRNYETWAWGVMLLEGLVCGN